MTIQTIIDSIRPSHPRDLESNDKIAAATLEQLTSNANILPGDDKEMLVHKYDALKELREDIASGKGKSLVNQYASLVQEFSTATQTAVDHSKRK